MKCGSLIFDTCQGLGVLAKGFVDHGVITHPVVVRHGRHEVQGWYPDAPHVGNLRDPGDQSVIRDVLGGCDVILFLETPFLWELIPTLRGRGVKTALVTMYECTPERLPAVPDLFVCPSLLDLEQFARYSREQSPGEPGYLWEGRHGAPATFVPYPVEVRWRQRTRAEVFVHNAGHGSFHDRNGTQALLESLWLCDCLKGTGGARFIIRYQGSLPDVGPKGDLAGKIEWRRGTAPADTLWDEGDVFVFPERFNGMSLPLQEARAAGMLVMATDRFPTNTWLPTRVGTDEEVARRCESLDPDLLIEMHAHDKMAWARSYFNYLIPVRGTTRARIGPPYREFERAEIDPRDVAARIDEWYGRDLTTYSLQGREWAKANSWDVLGTAWKVVLGNLKS